MASDSTNSRQVANLRDLARRIDSPDGLVGMLGMAMRTLVKEGEFSAAAVSVVRDNAYGETLAASGPTWLKDLLVGSRFDITEYESEIQNAEVWGVLRFVSVEDCVGVGVLHRDRNDQTEAMPEASGTLYAPLRSDSGRLLGIISAEIPADGAKPGIAVQRITAEIAELVGEVIEAQVEFPPDDPTPPPVLALSRQGTAHDHGLAGLPEHCDDETGLPNRSGLEAAFSASVDRLKASGTSSAVLYCVLEEYDSIVEGFGTEIAAEVLRSVSKRLLDSVRAYDVVGRMSSNTMAIVANNLAPADATSLVTRVRRTLAKVHVVDDEVIRIRGSVGVAIVTDHSANAESAFLAAQKAAETERLGANSTYVLYSRYTRSPFAVQRAR